MKFKFSDNQSKVSLKITTALVLIALFDSDLS